MGTKALALKTGISHHVLKNRRQEGMTIEEAIAYKPEKRASRPFRKSILIPDAYPRFSVELAKKYHSVITNTAIMPGV